jgi:hypothetical protein
VLGESGLDFDIVSDFLDDKSRACLLNDDFTTWDLTPMTAQTPYNDPSSNLPNLFFNLCEEIDWS